MRKNGRNNPYHGSSFASFLQDEGIYEEATGQAVKKVLAWQLAQALARGKITKTELASKMCTSRAAVNRLLDPNNPALNLRTMSKAAQALGKRLAIQLI